MSRQITGTETITKHYYQGVEYAIMPDMSTEDTDELMYLVVIGSFPEGRYRQPVIINPLIITESAFNYLDFICEMCYKSYRRHVLPESPTE